MNANVFTTKDYENKTASGFKKTNLVLSEVEWANSNPISSKAKMIVSLTLTKDYRKNDDLSVRINKPNSNPISENPKMNANLYIIEDYENETAHRPKKTNPNKPNFTYPQRGKTELRCRF